MAFLLCFSCGTFADFFGSGENILWESGKNLYIQLDEQDKFRSGNTPPNDHPVTLDGKQITDALKLIILWEKEGIFGEAGSIKVFSDSQANLLGNYLSQGLTKAKPDQDITFVLASLTGRLFKERVYASGRAFYHDNRLHIILGVHNRHTDKGAEAVAGGTGVSEMQYYFDVGSRAKSSDFKGNIITGDGIEAYTQGNKRRRDWIVIDVPVAAAAYIAQTEKKENPAGADAEAIRLEAAKLAKERRDMRAEMAKMRKEMNESMDNREELTIEERLAELDELHEKNLISDAEYEQKRKEILDDI